MVTDKEDLRSEIAHIRGIMELASQNKLLPDWSAIVGGCGVLIATAYTWSVTHSWDVRAVLWLPRPEKLPIVTLWVVVAVGTLILYRMIANKQAKELGISFNSRPTRLAHLAMGPSILAGAIITLRLLIDRDVGFIPGVWIMLYGIALYNAGLFSTKGTQWLGMCFFYTGIVAILFLSEYDLALTALSFGGYHILFGVHVLSSKNS